jgi:hypothetical protein
VTQFLLTVTAILTAGCIVLFIIARVQAERARRAEREAASLHEAVRQVKEKAGRLQKALGKQTQAEVKANEERKGLAGTPDTDLADRANGLFNNRKK